MGKLKVAIAEAQVAEDMSSRLNATVQQIKGNADGLVEKLQEAMKIDKVRSDRIDFVKDTILDVVIAAAYTLPGGMFVQGTLNLFRKKTLSSALWLARSGDSNLAKSVFGDHTNSNNTLSALPGDKYATDAAVVYNPSDIRGLGSDASSILNKQNPDMVKEHAYSLETAAGESLSKALKEFPGKEASALPRLCHDSVKDACSKGIKGDNEDGASIMMSSYKQALGQLQEVAYGGEAAVLSYALAAIADSVQLEQNGAHIARLGGFKLPVGGTPRIALGDAEVTRAKRDFKALNRLQQGWSDREKVGITKMEKAQRALSPDARDSYPSEDDWSAEQADKLIAFKACVTAYRGDLEEKLAQMCMSDVTKHVVQDVLGGSGGELIQKGGFDLKSNARHFFVDGNHGMLRSMVRFFSFGQAWSATSDGKARACLMVDAYILHKLLELHLGTPWLAPLANNRHTQKKVAAALLDVWNTIILSKAHAKNEKNLEKSLPLKELFAGPLVATYWSPIGAFLGELPKKLPNGTVQPRSETFEQFVKVGWRPNVEKVFETLGQGFSYQRQLAASVPNIRGWTVLDISSVPLYVGRFSPWLLDAANTVYEKAQNEGAIQQQILQWRDEYDGVADTSWVREDKDKDNPLASYVKWTKQRQALARFQDAGVGKTAKELVTRYEAMASAMESSAGAVGNLSDQSAAPGDKLISAYLAQRMGMELLIAGAADTAEVVKLLDDTMRTLIQLVAPQQYERYSKFYKQGKNFEAPASRLSKRQLAIRRGSWGHS